MNPAQLVPILNPEHFTGEIDPVLLCTICFGVLQGTRQCSNGHGFCLGCIERSIAATGEICPVCRVHVTLETLGVNRIADNLIGGLEIRCGDRRCDWRGVCRDRNQHITNQCMFTVVRCPNQASGCVAEFERREVAEHVVQCQFQLIACAHCAAPTMRSDLARHQDTCDMRPAPCPNGCGAVCIIRDQQQHNNSCPEMTIQCPFLDFGCEEVGLKRRDFARHQAEWASPHSELMRQKLCSMQNRFEAMLVVKDREVQNLTERCDTMATDQSVVDRIQAITNVVGSNVRAVNALIEKASQVTVNVTWMASCRSFERTMVSKRFVVNLGRQGEYSMWLKIEQEKGANWGFYLYAEGGSVYPLSIAGSTFTFAGKTLTFADTDLIEGSGQRRGWPGILSYRDVRSSSPFAAYIDTNLDVKGTICIPVIMETVKL